MFSRIVINDIKKELQGANFLIDGEFLVVKTNDKFDLVRYISLNDSYFIKRYKNDNKSRNYLLLEKYGIKTVDYYVVGDTIVMHKDINELNGYRKIEENDLLNDNVVKSLARWYRNLHNYTDESLVSFNYFTLHNLKKIIDSFNLGKNKALLYIYDNFDNINLKYSRVRKCLNYGDFSLDNAIICEDTGEVFMMDFDNLNNGSRCNDIDSVLNKLNCEKKEIFIDEYGKISDDEIIINYVVNSVVKLYLATKEKVLPFWVKGVLEDINNDKLYQSAFCLVNWY